MADIEKDGIQTNIALFGVAFQDEIDKPAEKPVFVHGLTGGTPFHFDRTIEAVQVACGSRAPSGGYVDSIETNPSIETLGYQEVAPVYFGGALGQIASSKVSDGIYKHVITLGNTIPYLTVFGQEGIDNFDKVLNCKVSELTAEFTNGEPLKLSPNLMGCNLRFLDEDPFKGCDPTCYDGWYLPTGGEFKLDTAGANPEDMVISSGNITINNNCEQKYGAASREPARIANGRNQVTVSMEVVCDDITPYRKMVTGKVKGVEPAQKIIYGSYFWKFVHSDNPNWYITIEGHRVPFSAEMPEVDPEGTGGAITFESEESYVKKIGDSPVIITIVNDVPNYTNPADSALPTVKPAVIDDGVEYGMETDEFGEMFINARAADRVLYGTANKIEDYEGFSEDPALQSGYYCCLEFDPSENVQVTMEKEGSDRPWVSLGDDDFCVFRLGGESIEATKIKVKDSSEETTEYKVAVKQNPAEAARTDRQSSSPGPSIPRPISSAPVKSATTQEPAAAKKANSGKEKAA